MANHKLLRLSATLVFIGLFVFEVVSLLHAAGANDHIATFTNYAHSGDWAAVHLGQFVSEAVLLAGLLVLFFALNVSQGTPRWLGFFAAIAAGVDLALAGVVYAVDGVALKQAVDAWTSAPAAQQAARFASAEAVRWLEWGVRNYQPGPAHGPGTTFAGSAHTGLFGRSLIRVVSEDPPVRFVYGCLNYGRRIPLIDAAGKRRSGNTAALPAGTPPRAMVDAPGSLRTL
jgi:hypothetical protein